MGCQALSNSIAGQCISHLYIMYSSCRQCLPYFKKAQLQFKKKATMWNETDIYLETIFKGKPLNGTKLVIYLCSQTQQTLSLTDLWHNCIITAHILILLHFKKYRWEVKSILVWVHEKMKCCTHDKTNKETNMQVK